MATRQFRIVTGTSGVGSALWLDGEEQKNVRSATVHVSAVEATRLIVEYINVEGTVEGDVDVVVEDDWTWAGELGGEEEE